MRTYVVIAAFNESSVLGVVLAELLGRYEVIVVDDGSTDNTAAVAREAGASVLRHVLNRGQGAALQTGITHALARGAEAIVTFDADGQHVAADIDCLVAPLLSGEADIVLGSRFLANRGAVPTGRRLLLRAAVLFTWLNSGVRLSDAHNGMRAFSRKAAQMLEIRLDRMAHASELVDQVRRSRLRYVEVPVQIRYTDYSLAKGQRAGSAFRVLFDYFMSKLLR